MILFPPNVNRRGCFSFIDIRLSDPPIETFLLATSLDPLSGTMPSSSNSTPSVSRARQTPKPVSEARPAASRVTRLRSGKEGSASPALGAKPSGLLAKGKEGLRKASDKIKDKEIVRPKIQPLEGTSYTESLQVGSSVLVSM